MKARGFYRCDAAWYAEANGFDLPRFTIGVYDVEENGKTGGPAGEFVIYQGEVGLQLKCYSDAWSVLVSDFSGLLAFLALRGTDLTPAELEAWLNNSGVIDLTPRQAPDSDAATTAADRLWRDYQTGRASLDHTDREVFVEVVAKALRHEVST